jgi:hypothetical protein
VADLASTFTEVSYTKYRTFPTRTGNAKARSVVYHTVPNLTYSGNPRIDRFWRATFNFHVVHSYRAFRLEGHSKDARHRRYDSSLGIHPNRECFWLTAAWGYGRNVSCRGEAASCRSIKSRILEGMSRICRSHRRRSSPATLAEISPRPAFRGVEAADADRVRILPVE